MNKSKTVIRVLVADDHTVVRDGLAAIIRQEKDMDVVAEAGNGRQAVELWKRHHPDVTLMDLRMPELDGVNAIYEIRAADPQARIVVLTTFDGDEDIYRGGCAPGQNPICSKTLTAMKCSGAFVKCMPGECLCRRPLRRNWPNGCRPKN